jgi:hypothetical protein
MKKHIPLAPGWLICKKDDGSVCAHFGNDPDFQVTIFSDVLVIEPVNLFGSKKVARMMEEDGLPHNKPTTTTLESLFELTKRYDVTLRTRDITRVFLAQQTTFLPGPSDE